MVPPGIYLPLPLDIFEIALKTPKDNEIQEAEFTEIKENN